MADVFNVSRRNGDVGQAPHSFAANRSVRLRRRGRAGGKGERYGTRNKGEGRGARAVGRSEGGDGRMLAAGIYRAATAQYVACLGETRRECDTRGFQPST